MSKCRLFFVLNKTVALRTEMRLLPSPIMTESFSQQYINANGQRFDDLNKTEGICPTTSTLEICSKEQQMQRPSVESTREMRTDEFVINCSA